MSRIVTLLLAAAVIAAGPVAAHAELAAAPTADTAQLAGPEPAATQAGASEGCTQSDASAECHLNVVLADAYGVSAPGGIAPGALHEPVGKALHGPGIHAPPPRI